MKVEDSMTANFKVGDRVRYLGTPYSEIAKGSLGIVKYFSHGESGALYAYVHFDGYQGAYGMVVNGFGPAYEGPEIEKMENA